MTAERLRFDRFVLESDSGELRMGRDPVPLQPQPARVLEALLRASGRVVSREELAGLLWGDEHHVDRDLGLNQCVSQIRRALGDDAQQPRFIETVPRRGYRFLQAVELEEGPVTVASARRPPTGSLLRRRPLVVPAGLFALVLLAAALWRAQASGPDPDRLAVLAVRNLTGSGRWDALAESLSVELTARVAQALDGGLEVSVAGAALRPDADERRPGEIGREIGAGLLLQVCLGHAGDGLRGTAQLIDSDAEVVVWSYEAALDPGERGSWTDGLVRGLALHLARVRARDL